MGSIKSRNLLTKRNRPPGPFVWLTLELLESEAWQTAPLRTRLFVERLMREHIAHGGVENGRLICTFDDCAVAGIRRNAIKEAQRDAIARGLVYRSAEGRAAAGAGRRPHQFGLGWFPAHDGAAAPNRWKSWTTPAPAVYQQDVYSSNKGSTKLKGGKPRACATRPANKVPTGAPEKVPTGGLEKTFSGAARPSPPVPPRPSRPSQPSIRTSLPPGWKAAKADDGRVRILTDSGTGLPVADHPLVGDAKQRAALLYYQDWKEKAVDREEHERRVGRGGQARVDGGEVQEQRGRMAGPGPEGRRSNVAATATP